MEKTSEIIHLEHNESYWLLDDKLTAAYQNFDALDFTTYPEYEGLRGALAEYAGVSEKSLLVTAGSDAAIRLLAEQLRSENKTAILPVPTFYGYERIFSQVGLPVQMIPFAERDGSFAFPTDAVIQELSNTNAIFLCQPNNPLGSEIGQEDLDRLISAAKHAHAQVVIDEAYYEFSGKTLIDRVEKDSLIIIRTLSKAFGLAGARVGYCIANVEAIEELGARSLPWPISHLSTKTALAALDHRERVQRRRELLIAARDALIRELAGLPRATVFPSATNFIFFRVPNAQNVATMLARARILLAECESMSVCPDARLLLKDALRMAVPAPDHTQRVVDALRQSLDNRS